MGKPEGFCPRLSWKSVQNFFFHKNPHSMPEIRWKMRFCTFSCGYLLKKLLSDQGYPQNGQYLLKKTELGEKCSFWAFSMKFRK
jgi:hypothetical protein